MAYATTAELAAALRIRETPENVALLQSCLDAAASEIDAELDLGTGEVLPDPAPASVNRTNVNRAVEWYKANDNADGVVGTDQAGKLSLPDDGFRRHAAAIGALKSGFGVA